MVHELIIFALVFTASALPPGPDTMTIFSRGLASGRLSALPFTVGVIAAKLSLMTLVILGLAALAQSFGAFFIILKFSGAAYLIWAGIRTWRKSGEPNAHELSKQVTWRDSITGFVLGVSNPQAIAFYIALLPAAIDIQTLTLSTYISLCLVLSVTMLLVASLYALTADRLRHLLRSPKARKVTNRVAGGVMVGSGVLVASR